MRLNNVLFVTALACSVMVSAGCSTVRPKSGSSGSVAVVVAPVPTGQAHTAPLPVSYELTIQHEEMFDDLMSSDGVRLDFDSVMSFRITSSVALTGDFGTVFYRNSIQNEFRDLVRQAVRKHNMNELVISPATIDAIDAEVIQQMKSHLESSDQKVDRIEITSRRV